MTLHHAIKIKSKIYTFYKTNDESREIYLNRIQYIRNELIKNNKANIDDLIKKSLIDRNIKFFGMVYNYD
jgi:hypothetical protein